MNPLIENTEWDVDTTKPLLPRLARVAGFGLSAVVLVAVSLVCLMDRIPAPPDLISRHPAGLRHIVRHATRPVPPLAKTIKKIDREFVLNALLLHDLKKDYTCVFKGKVNCRKALCRNTQVRIHVASNQNPSILKTITPEPDGTYEVSVPLSESPLEQMDWTIMADSPESQSLQIQGRQILGNDSAVTIEEPIRLL